jgi:hypothetical protein
MCFLLGCSGVLQSFAARIVTRQLADQFGLDEAQKTRTREAVDRLLAEAPSVLDRPLTELVQTVDSAIASGLTEDNLKQIESEFDAIADTVVGRVIDEASPILASMNDDQIAHAEQRFAERFEEIRDDIERSPKKRLEQRQDAFLESVEDWTGDLSKEQERALRAHVTRLPDETEIRLRAEEKIIADLAAVLRSHPGASEVRTALWDAWKRRDDWGPQARSVPERDAQGRRTLIYIDSLLTPAQRAHSREHLKDLHNKLKRFFGASGS